MSSTIRYGLLANHSSLVRKLDPDEVMPFLIEANLVTPNEKESIDSESTNARRSGALLIIIHRRGFSDEDVYKRFLAILEDDYCSSGQQLKDLVTRIRDDAMNPKVVAKFKTRPTRLDEGKRAALRREESRLVATMNVEDVIPDLVSYGVLSLDDSERIMAKATFSERAQLVVELVYEKSEQHFARFVSTLIETEMYRESGERLKKEGYVEEDVDMIGTVVSTSTGIDPQDIFEKSDNLWQRLFKEYPDVLRENEEMLELQNQLWNKETVMCVFGRHNCGKSTLLNALLVNRCLPTHIKNETGVHVKIKHDPSVHPGYCTDACQGYCPRLSDGTNTTVGAEDIWSVLQRANVQHRQTGMQVKKEYTLYAHVPILKDVPAGWNLVLVDTPGFGEANMKSITSLATRLLNTSSAYLYIVDANSTGDEMDTKNLRCIFERDQKVFLDNRIVIAVTKYDACCPKPSSRGRTRKRVENLLSPQELRQLIREQVKDTTGMDCPPEIIVPVSAEWAEQARELRQDPLETSLRHDVTESLRKVPDTVMQGQGETAFGIPSLTLASQLERSSGLLELEERLRGMIEHCIQSWVLGLATGYTDHLSKVKTTLEVQLEREEKDKGDIQHALQQHEKYKTAKEKFMGKAFRDGGESQIEKDLKTKFEEGDMKEAQDVASREISNLMKTFAATVKVDVMKNNPAFGEESLRKSIKKFVEEELEPTLQTHLQESRLLNVASEFRDHHHQIDVMDRSIEEAALEFLPEDWNPQNDTLRKHREFAVKNIQGKELLESRELTVGQLPVIKDQPAVPRIKIPWYKRWGDSIMRFLRFKVEERPYRDWSEELDAMVQDFEEMSISQAKNYIEKDLKDWVASTLADIYYTQMKHRAEAICETFDLDVRRRLDELKEMEKVAEPRIKKVFRDVEEISENLKSLEKLHSPGN